MAKKKHIEVDEMTHKLIKELAAVRGMSMRELLNRIAMEEKIKEMKK